MLNGASFNTEENSRYEAARKRGDRSTMAAIEVEVDQRYLKWEAEQEADRQSRAIQAALKPAVKPTPALAKVLLMSTPAPALEATPALDGQLEYLATFSVLEYDLLRRETAKKLNIRLSTLDFEVAKRRPQPAGAGTQLQGAEVLFNEPEPWPHPVDGSKLFSACASMLSDYVHLPSGAADATSLWAGAAHSFEDFAHSPRLNVKAATRGCGKTLTLDVVATITPRSVRFENMTQAVLFRIIAKHKPTLLIDECDRHLKNNNELIGLLNSGFTRGGTVPRCEGDQNEVRFFPVFGPVALSGIGDLSGTLHDRSIVINLERARPDEVKKRFDSRHVGPQTELKRKLMRWAADHKAELAAADPAMPMAFNRVADVWRPLFAVAMVVGGDWPKRARVAFAQIQRPDSDSEPIQVQCLQDVAAVMEAGGFEIIATHELVERLVLLDERPWQTWNKGRPISPRQLARLLKGFGVVPSSRRDGADTFKGYRLDSLSDALSRYVPAQEPMGGNLSVTASQPNNGAACSDFLSVTTKNSVTDKIKPKPSNDAACDGVTDKTPPTDPEIEF